jgi:hypothetical protein
MIRDQRAQLWHQACASARTARRRADTAKAARVSGGLLIGMVLAELLYRGSPETAIGLLLVGLAVHLWLYRRWWGWVYGPRLLLWRFRAWKGRRRR